MSERRIIQSVQAGPIRTSLLAGIFLASLEGADIRSSEFRGSGLLVEFRYAGSSWRLQLDPLTGRPAKK